MRITYAQSVRVDRQDNIWIVDQYSNMAVKFDPEGRVLMTFGRRPETAGSIAANVQACSGCGRWCSGPWCSRRRGHARRSPWGC